MFIKLLIFNYLMRTNTCFVDYALFHQFPKFNLKYESKLHKTP